MGYAYLFATDQVGNNLVCFPRHFTPLEHPLRSFQRGLAEAALCAV